MNMLPPSMIQVSPQIKLKPFQRSGRTFIPRQIHLTGMRIMIEARDDSGQTLWKDFPTSHGLYAPCLYDPTTRTTNALPSMDWWSAPLARLFSEPHVKETSIQIHRRRKAKTWIILNTLDTIFGHSLLLLLNAQYYLDHFPQHGLIVIATPELLRYIPDDVHEIWELKTTPRETERWHAPLEKLFHQRCAEAEVHIATAPSHPDPSRYDLRHFNIIPSEKPRITFAEASKSISAGMSPKAAEDAPNPLGEGRGEGPLVANESANLPNTITPKIIFIFRGTRLWGGAWRSERARLIRLARWLKKLWPDSNLIIHGHAQLPSVVPHWTDRTRLNTAEDYDGRLIHDLATADLVLGAHGSSQLLPSAIARLVLQLTQLDKQPSLLQDFLFDAPGTSTGNADSDASPNLRQHLWRRRFLYGNSTLSDISPRQVAQLINAMISMQAQFDFYQSTSASDPLRDPAKIEKDFAEEISPQIEAWNQRLQQTLDRRLSTRFKNYLRRLLAERD